jgi:hypothetical protein
MDPQFQNLDPAAAGAVQSTDARVQGLVDLLARTPPVDPGVIRRAVAEELEDQRYCLRVALIEVPDAAPALAALATEPEGFARDALAAVLEGADHAVSDRLEAAITRYDRFMERIGRRLQPTAGEAAQEPGPARDAAPQSQSPT